MKVDLPPDLPKLSPRDDESHKGDFGHALLVGGSRAMPGSISLSGMAALAGGSGLVSLAVPESIQQTVAGFNPCYMVHPLMESTGTIISAEFTTVEKLAAGCDVIGLGPGLGTRGVEKFVIDLNERLATPLVLDADGLNALASRPRSLLRIGGPRILTPHPGEIARLLQLDSPPKGQDARIEAAKKLAKSPERGEMVVVLKGHRTIVTDGEILVFNETGNPGMATGGTGDVLTGLITAFVAQGLSAWNGARLGAFVHGLAGDLAAQSRGQVGMTALDVLAHLPQAIEQVGAAAS